MASSLVSSFANGVAIAAIYTIGAVLGILTGTAAVAGAVSQSGHVLNYAHTAVKGVVEVAGGAVAVYAVWILTALTLKVVGFTTGGPAAGSFAAAWMSRTAVANGGAVPAMSLYSIVQATAMGGGVLLRAPAAGAVAVAVGAVLYKTWFSELSTFVPHRSITVHK